MLRRKVSNWVRERGEQSRMQTIAGPRTCHPPPFTSQTSPCHSNIGLEPHSPQLCQLFRGALSSHQALHMRSTLDLGKRCVHATSFRDPHDSTPLTKAEGLIAALESSKDWRQRLKGRGTRIVVILCAMPFILVFLSISPLLTCMWPNPRSY